MCADWRQPQGEHRGACKRVCTQEFVPGLLNITVARAKEVGMHDNMKILSDNSSPLKHIGCLCGHTSTQTQLTPLYLTVLSFHTPTVC